MTEPRINERDSQLLEELEKYADQWVALRRHGQGAAAVLGSGSTIDEARAKAEANGHTDFFLYRVRSEPPAPDG